jgi:hypothetical protein
VAGPTFQLQSDRFVCACGASATVNAEHMHEKERPKPQTSVNRDKLKPKPSVGIGAHKIAEPYMCQSCVEIDKQVECHRELLRSTTDPAEIERIKRLIAKLYGDRLRLHKSPER